MYCKITQGLQFLGPISILILNEDFTSWYTEMFMHILQSLKKLIRVLTRGPCFHFSIKKSYSVKVSYWPIHFRKQDDPYFRNGFVSRVLLSCNWAIFNKITKRSPDSNSQSLSSNMYCSQVFLFTSQILAVIVGS